MSRNHVSNLLDFMRAWDAPELGDNKLMPPVKRSAQGNLNLAGTPECNAGPAVTCRHPAFLDCIEDGVRELVGALIADLDCITYSSCEGHRGKPGAVVARERRVGIVPRNQEEYTRCLQRLEPVAKRANAALGSADVAVVLVKGEVTTEGASLPCIDLLFACLRDETGYFRELDAAQRQFLRELRSGPKLAP